MAQIYNQLASSHPTKRPQLVLASTSAYRREMLSRLKVAFETADPKVDESPLNAETPIALARRLALLKAQAVAKHYPHAVVIGADQVLDVNGQALGKPGEIDAARAQLSLLSGKTVIFHSALAVVSPTSTAVSVSQCRATFRHLTGAQINHYLNVDQPFDTAGSAKAESLGIALLTELSSNDPTSIIGLPLIELTRMLCRVGLDPLNQPV